MLKWKLLRFFVWIYTGYGKSRVGRWVQFSFLCSLCSLLLSSLWWFLHLCKSSSTSVLPDDVTVLCVSHTQHEVTLLSSWGSQGLQLTCAALPHGAILELAAQSLAPAFPPRPFLGGWTCRHVFKGACFQRLEAQGTIPRWLCGAGSCTPSLPTESEEV